MKEASFVVATGQITDAIGSGQKDVRIVAFLKNADSSAGRQIAEASSNAMGDFTLRADADPGTVELIVRCSKDQFAELTRIVQLEAGKPPPFIGEALEGNLKLRGKVVSAADKKPVPAVKVVFENSFTHREVETDSTGHFEIDSLSPVQGQLEVTSTEFGREVKTVRVPVSDELTIELKPQRTVLFLVTDRANAPLAGAVLECVDPVRHDFRTLITGDDGTAALAGLHFDATKIAVRLSREGYVPIAGTGESVSLPHDKTEFRHTFIMDKAATISGVVRNAKDHKPLHGARVFAGDRYTDDAPKDWTGTDGRFTLSQVRSGMVTVTVQLEGHAPELKVVEAAAGEMASLTFELGPASVVRGTVKNEKDEPVAGIEVAATNWRGRRTLGLRAITDQQGQFTLENAPADEFSLSIFGSTAMPTRAVRPGAGSEVAFVLENNQASPGRTGVLTGQPVPDIAITTLEGKMIRLRELGGKTVLLIFWATWCAPCVAEVPLLVELHEKFRGRNDFIMLGISRDFEEDALRDFIKDHPKMTWPQAFGEAGGSDAAAEAFGVSGIPAISLIGPDGKILATDLRDERITQEVEKSLGAKPAP